MHQINQLIDLFNQTFQRSEQTILVSGEDEPLYLPADQQCAYHRVIFAHGFFSSALHELAHWCIAGERRRQLVDYGYWYEADGRSADKQLDFAKVEARPQALEWILAKACGHRFVISLDNLTGDAIDITPFRQAVFNEIKHYQQHGLNPRAQLLQKVLSEFYHQDGDYTQYPVCLEDLK